MGWYDMGRWWIVVWVVLCWVKGPVWFGWRGKGVCGGNRDMHTVIIRFIERERLVWD